MTTEQALLDYILRLGDNALILGQRLSEWCGHGPVLEQDIALANISLDLIGQASAIYTLAAKLEGSGKSEDDFAFLRDAQAYRNVLLVEQANGDWAVTMARQFFFDVYNYYNYQALRSSNNAELAAIAEKSLKEVTYHLRFSSEWMLRLGDGTEESHRRLQTAVDDLWMYTGELYTPNAVDRQLAAAGLAPDLTALAVQWKNKVREVLEKATLQVPAEGWMQLGGKDGTHTEHLGFILAEMQYLQRAYPGAKW